MAEVGHGQKEKERLMDKNKEGGRIGDAEYVEDKYIGDYRFVRRLGSGSSSKVVLAHATGTNEKVAIKIVPRRIGMGGRASNSEIRCDQRILREAVISCVLNHPHIVKLKDFLYNSTHYFLVFEYVKGKRLYDMVTGEGPLEEVDARRYFRQLLSAVDYIHRNSIVHRDLKIENILVDEDDNIRLIDFGLSNFYDNKMLLNTFCGSLYFAAPELLSGQRYCGPEVDVWSLGVVLYVMLCGCVPFDDENVHGLQAKIKRAEFGFCKSVSREATELVREMIVVQPSQRMGLDQVIESEWVSGGKEEGITNYMTKRHPLENINERCVVELSLALSFQFPRLEKEVRRFQRICAEDGGTLEQIYWSRRPAVSLYYLVLESLRDAEMPGMEDVEEGCPGSLPESVYRFVRFMSLRRKEECLRYTDEKSVFMRQKDGEMSESDEGTKKECGMPKVRKTYVKGIFKGIRVRHVGCHNALKKILLDVFNMNGILYEVGERSYFCTLQMEETECHFKISMYFNVILDEYCLIVTSLSGERTLFKVVYERILCGMRNRG